MLLYIYEQRALRLFFIRTREFNMKGWAVAGAECNTVIELTQEHHIA